MNTFGISPLFLAIVAMGVVAPAASAQTVTATGTESSSALSPSASATHPQLNLGELPPSPGPQSSAVPAAPRDQTDSSSFHATPPPPDLGYTRPTEKKKLRNYLFDAFGPYPIAGAVIFGGVGQEEKSPPEWGQGAAAYGERVGSLFGIALVTTTTRYALAAAFREDTLYYRCECDGFTHRLRHALISTVTARHGDDGHRRLSFPALIAPYAGTMTAVYGWYPSRYGVKDGFRIGNYDLLAFAAGNIAREFIYGGPHTWFSRANRGPATETDVSANANPVR
jgi:hypothetical protein